MTKAKTFTAEQFENWGRKGGQSKSEKKLAHLKKLAAKRKKNPTKKRKAK